MVMWTKLCYVAVLFVVLFANISEAKDQFKMIDVINAAPRCYALSEFKSHFVDDWEDDLGTLYTNYSNASHFLQFMQMKSGKMEKVNTETILNTAAIMFNDVATEKRKLLIDFVVKMKGDRIRIGRLISEVYEKEGCSKFSRLIHKDEYQVE